jgi:hypothetical protein
MNKPQKLTRRTFLGVAGGTAAMALAACGGQPATTEEPAAEEPKDIEAEVDAIMAEVHEAADAPAEETSEE